MYDLPMPLHLNAKNGLARLKVSERMLTLTSRSQNDIFLEEKKEKGSKKSPVV